jgi:hypothetical protein
MTTTEDRSRTRETRTAATLDLHNISLTTKEDWGRFVDAPSRVKPDDASREKLDGLSDTARRQYNQLRLDWHANLGPFRTPQYKALHADLWPGQVDGRATVRQGVPSRADRRRRSPYRERSRTLANLLGVTDRQHHAA